MTKHSFYESLLGQIEHFSAFFLLWFQNGYFIITSFLAKISLLIFYSFSYVLLLFIALLRSLFYILWLLCKQHRLEIQNLAWKEIWIINNYFSLVETLLSFSFHSLFILVLHSPHLSFYIISLIYLLDFIFSLSYFLHYINALPFQIIFLPMSPNSLLSNPT